MAQAASAATAGSVQARLRICAVASAATRVAWSQTAFRSSAVRFSAVGRVRPVRGPPLPQLGPAQVRREFPAAVPDRAAVLGGVAGQGDRVPGDLTGVLDAEPLAHQHPGLIQAREELVLAARGRGGGGDLPSQRDPGGFVQAAAGGLLVLGAGRTAGRGAVGGRGGAQPVPLLGGEAGGADLVPFPGQAGFAAVLAGQHGDEMDVVVAVPDGDPADGLVFLPVGGQPGAVHDLVRDGGPFVVGQHPVVGSGAHRAVPDRPRVAPLAERGLRLHQQPGQLGEVPLAVRPQRRFEAGWVTPARDDMGIGVFLVAAGTEQVVQQRFDVLPARGADLPDHPVTVAATANLTPGPCARRRLPRRCGRRGGCSRRRSRAGPRRAARWRSASRPPG